MLPLSQMQSWFSLLNLVVLQPDEKGHMHTDRIHCPAWWDQVLDLPNANPFIATETFPFLEIFWDDALDWWQQKRQHLCRSGIWAQPLTNGEVLHLEAAAATLNGNPLLLIGPFLFDLDRMQEILQKTRQLHLDHEALERAQAALAASEVRQKRILQALPDRFALCDATAHITQHNHPDFQGQDVAWLTLRDLFGSDLQEHFLNQTQASQTNTWDFDRVIGDQARTFEARTVPMDEKSWLVMVRDVSEVRQLERRKAEFLSIAGHELRTPLTSIKGSLKMVNKAFSAQIPEKVVHMLEIASRNSERLVHLVNDLLDLQRIELATRSFEKSRTHLPQLIKAVVEENQMFAQEFQVNLKWGDLQDCYAVIDPAAINQVLTNLISNGCKFTPAGGSVTLSLKQVANRNVITVADTGPGIPPKYQDRLFQKFAHIPGPSDGHVKGTGLGLSICKAIVDEHMGQITFDSSENGTQFHVTL